MSYQQLEERASCWRGGLQSAGIGVGDRLVIVSGNDETFVLAYLASLGVGAAAVPLNPQSPAAELAREVDAVGPAAAIVAPELQPVWDSAISAMDSVPAFIDLALLERSEPASITSVPSDTPAVLLFTSGTAGMPKPAVLTHGNLDASLRAMLTVPVDLLDADHVVLAVIPLFHVFGLNTVVNLGLLIGATLVLDEFRSAQQVGELVARHKVTVLGGPPTLWLVLARSGQTRPEQFQSLALALSGAAKLAPAVHGEVEQALGIKLSEGYGLTETSAVVATAIGTDAPVGSVGRLLGGVEARLVDADGGDVLVGDPGQLWVRGPMISPGYFERDSVTGDETIVEISDADGWLKTGDVAVVDDEGNLAIVDRLKDLVIVSGFNVYPGEVEVVLKAHPTVAEAAITGEPDPATGERLLAHVVAEEGQKINDEELLEHCRQQLARYKVPRRIEMRDSLPQGLGGKIRRHELT